MKFLSPFAHGMLDYGTVVLFLAAPSLFTLSPTAATLCYILSGVHLLMTLLTDFPAAPLRMVPLPLHGIVEFMVAAGLIAVPWLVGSPFSDNDIGFFMVVGAAIFLVWLVTQYQEEG